MPKKIYFAKKEIASIDGLPEIGTPAQNFDVVQLNGKYIKQLKHQKGRYVILNIISNCFCEDFETNKKFNETSLYSINIINDIFKDDSSVSVFHIMSSGPSAKCMMENNLDNFSILLNPEKFAKNYGLEIPNINKNAQVKLKSKKQEEIFLAKALIVINKEGNIVYHELVQELTELPNIKDCYEATLGIVKTKEISKPPKIKLSVNTKDRSEALYRKFWNNDLYRQELIIKSTIKKDEDPYTKFLKDKQCIELRSRMNLELDRENNLRKKSEYTKIKELIYDEIMTSGRQYSELMEERTQKAKDEFNQKKLDEDNQTFDYEVKVVLEKMHELKNVFMVLGKSYDKMGKIEERFQKIANKLSDWLNGATLLSEILENQEDITLFANALIVLLARKIINHFVNEKVFFEKLNATIDECLEECANFDQDSMSDNFKILNKMLNNKEQRKMIARDLYSHVSKILIDDDFIVDICLNPKILSYEIDAINPLPTPSSTKSNFSVASEIANSLTILNIDSIEENNEDSFNEPLSPKNEFLTAFVNNNSEIVTTDNSENETINNSEKENNSPAQPQNHINDLSFKVTDETRRKLKI